MPQFVLRDATLTRIIPMGNGKHTKLIVAKDGVSVVAVYFGMATASFPYHVNDRVDLLFRLNINEYQNERTLQLFVQSIPPPPDNIGTSIQDLLSIFERTGDDNIKTFQKGTKFVSRETKNTLEIILNGNTIYKGEVKI